MYYIILPFFATLSLLTYSLVALGMHLARGEWWGFVPFLTIIGLTALFIMIVRFAVTYAGNLSQLYNVVENVDYMLRKVKPQKRTWFRQQLALKPEEFRKRY